MCEAKENKYINFQTGKELDWSMVDKLKDNAMLKHRPDLWEVWDFTQNVNDDIYKVSYGSGKKVFFKCMECGNIVPQFIKNKVNGHGCKVCIGKVASEHYNLGILYPQLIKEWHPTLNGHLTPYDVTPSSEKQKFWWVCDKGHYYDAMVGDRKNGNGCPYCSNRRVLVGYNNVGFTHPRIKDILLNKSDADIYSHGSKQKLEFVCGCGNRINKQLVTVVRQGLCCPICNDGISFGEKVMLNLLSDNGVNFKYDSTTNYSQGRRYDFILDEISTIIEINGEQHYKRTFETLSHRTLDEEQENDRLKEQLARENGIEHYYNIEVSDRNIDVLSNRIRELGLLEKLKLCNVDWKEIEKKSLSSMIIFVCKAFDENPTFGNTELSNMFKLSTATITKYLKIGQRLKLCSYNKDSMNERVAINNKKSKSIVQMDESYCFIRVYHSMSKAGIEVYNNRGTGRYIKDRCEGNESILKGYYWMYLEEYEQKYGKLS